MLKWMMKIWQANVSLKIKIFTWQVCNDKIQSAEQLVKRNWLGDIECKMCGRLESTGHIIFECAMVQFVWCFCKDVFEWQYTPKTVEDFQERVQC